jgi:hypothetical protein
LGVNQRGRQNGRQQAREKPFTERVRHILDDTVRAAAANP